NDLSRRRFGIACVVGTALSCIAFVWMASDRTWSLLHGDVTSGFYDAQAHSLIAGHWYMPASLLGLEGFKTGTHYYMYFGPVPALLRVPLLVFTHHFDGRLSGVSMLAAELVALGFTSALLWRARWFVRGSGVPVGRMEAALTGGFVFLVGAGSSFLYLASWLSVYDEAELWACAFALGTLYFMITFMMRHTRKSLLLIALFISLTLFTRATIGFGLLGALAICAVIDFRRRNHGGGLVWVAALAGVIACPVIAYAILNEIKFHSLFGVPFQRQAADHISPLYGLAVRKNGGTLFHVGFIPTNFVNYLRPDAFRFTSLFPWINFRPASIIGTHWYGGIESPTSIVATAPTLVGLSLVGMFGVFRRANRADRLIGSASGAEPGLSTLRVPVIGAALAAASIFVYGFLSTRYLTDLLPLVILTGAAGFSLIAAGSTWPRWWRRLLIVACVALGLVGVWIQTSLALVYQGAAAPSPSVTAMSRFIALRESIDGTVLSNKAAGVKQVSELAKAHGSPGDLAIVGNCSALYESSGRSWTPVEVSHASGHFRFELVGAPGVVGESWTVLVIGGGPTGATLTVSRLNHGKAMISYRFGGATAVDLKGTPFRVRPGATEVFDVTVDRSRALVAVTEGAQTPFAEDAQTVFAAYAPIPPGPMLEARTTRGGSAGSSAYGPVKSLRVTTPICANLLRALRTK
ncbi:MAG TPA: hypothetical protein VKR22_01145, partial [Acidimicrobiales bacterium]|nr:hypothetical protein [Acidimicrobiales bacterium]